MARPWVPIGYLPTRPAGGVDHAHEIVPVLAGDGDPVVALVLIEGRQYLTHWEAGRWLVSMR